MAPIPIHNHMTPVPPIMFVIAPTLHTASSHLHGKRSPAKT